MSRLVLWFSCGAASATMCKSALNNQDLIRDFDEVVIAYCRVREEHPDNMRFLKACEEWFEQEIIVLEHEGYKGSIFNVFEKNYMRTPSGAPCTRALKKQVRSKFQRDGDVHCFGYHLGEEKRAKDFEIRNPTLQVEWPLIDAGLNKDNCLALVARAGIELPEMYLLGYEHNNCIGCVKGGMGYWNKIRKDFPEAFERMANFEVRKGYTVLKESDGSPLYLVDLEPNRGRLSDEPKIECGIACEVAESQMNGGLI